MKIESRPNIDLKSAISEHMILPGWQYNTKYFNVSINGGQFKFQTRRDTMIIADKFFISVGGNVTSRSMPAESYFEIQAQINRLEINFANKTPQSIVLQARPFGERLVSTFSLFRHNGRVYIVFINPKKKNVFWRQDELKSLIMHN